MSLAIRKRGGGVSGTGSGGVSTPLASARYKRTAGDYATTSTTWADVDPTNFSLTITTGARRVLIGYAGTGTNANSGAVTSLDVTVDGTRVASDATYGIIGMQPAAAYYAQDASFTFITDVLAAGSHTFRLQWRVSHGTGVLRGDGAAQTAAIFWVTEIPDTIGGGGGGGGGGASVAVQAEAPSNPAVGALWVDTDDTTGSASLAGMVPIAEIIVGAAGQATLDFTGIVGMYRHLRMVGMVRSTGNGAGSLNMSIQVNGLTTAIYSSRRFSGAGTVSAGAGTTGTTGAQTAFIADSTQAAGIFTLYECSIPYYSVSAFRKAFRSTNLIADGNEIDEFAGNFNLTAPITQVTFTPSAGNFAEHSRMTLYGLQ